jgi:hypothetical protein
MPKLMSIAQLGRGGLVRAIRAAQHEPMLVSELNHPVAWIVSAEALARAASRRGAGDTYEAMLQLLGIELPPAVRAENEELTSSSRPPRS